MVDRVYIDIEGRFQLELDDKITKTFGKLAMDKRRLPSSGLVKIGIPSYVAEWILEEKVPGDGEITKAEMEQLNEFIEKAVPGKNERNIYKNRLLAGETVKILTYIRVEIDLSRKTRERFGIIPTLAVHDAIIPTSIIESNPDLLRHGMWGIVFLTLSDDGIVIDQFKALQAKVNLEYFYKMRSQFSPEEWVHLMLQSAGYNSQCYNEIEQIWLIARLIPIVQKNAHIIELAPKGTGKSYMYENISPRVKIVSGGNLSPAVMFYNNAKGQDGLLACYDVLVLDEVQKIKFDKPEEIIGNLKGYLANNRISRGGKITIPSDCCLVLLANIKLDENLQPFSENLVEELQDYWHETALLDRFNGIIPGWMLPKFEDKMIARSYGLKADFFANTLTAMRDDIRFEEYTRRHIEFDDEVKIRDQKAIIANSSAFVKLLFPDCNITESDFQHYCLKPAVAMRQYIRDHLWLLDAEYRQSSKYIAARTTGFQECPSEKM